MPILFDGNDLPRVPIPAVQRISAKPKACRRHFASRSTLRFGNLCRVSSSMSIEQRSAETLAERERLRAENYRLREPLGIPNAETLPPLPSLQPALNAAAAVNAKSSPEEKVKLFRSLFRGREDVYAVRWEGRNGKVGYTPAYRRDWGTSFRKIPNNEKEYFPLTDQVIHDHLTGKQTVGVYPLLTDETCWFLAADFDKASWQEDARAFLQTCSSGKSPPLSNGRARVVADTSGFSLTRPCRRPCSKTRRGIAHPNNGAPTPTGPRFIRPLFPSQDTMPKGGFGNLIALPMQHMPRRHGNSVFLTPASSRTPTNGLFCPASGE